MKVDLLRGRDQNWIADLFSMYVDRLVGSLVVCASLAGKCEFPRKRGYIVKIQQKAGISFSLSVGSLCYT